MFVTTNSRKPFTCLFQWSQKCFQTCTINHFLSSPDILSLFPSKDTSQGVLNSWKRYKDASGTLGTIQWVVLMSEPRATFAPLVRAFPLDGPVNICHDIVTGKVTMFKNRPKCAGKEYELGWWWGILDKTLAKVLCDLGFDLLFLWPLKNYLIVHQF